MKVNDIFQMCHKKKNCKLSIYRVWFHFMMKILALLTWHNISSGKCCKSVPSQVNNFCLDHLKVNLFHYQSFLNVLCTNAYGSPVKSPSLERYQMLLLFWTKFFMRSKVVVPQKKRLNKLCIVLPIQNLVWKALI